MGEGYARSGSLDRTTSARGGDSASISQAGPVNGDTLDREMTHAQDGTYYSAFFYASWRPFSQKCRSIFDTLGSIFRQIRHFAVEQYSAMPSVFSRYGIHGFPAFVLTSRTTSVRYHGLKDLDSSVYFYRELTGANMKNKGIMKKPRRESDISSLPPELLERILLEALATSPTPIRDIIYFKQT
ncbi:hypothetical protein KFK09_009066 [Dendrobium nobile]|uniref:Thioredoxin domain-containing protein n=1 Tax=Dendrobium nobile TaxID=94219 RepID=A0A8T3BSK2_DENNO|nr:hypothetical protein KFK09_009066 [Dendrobium nobile]